MIGTDSHTCMAGAIGCFAFGVGSTDMANSWFTKDVRVKVPESVRVNVRGTMPAGVCSKDLMLHLLSDEFFKTGAGIGKVLEFAGPAVTAMSLDERATLTNMAVEAGGFTGIIEADEVIVEYIAQQRGTDRSKLRAQIVRADAGATYCKTFDIDLSTLQPTVALPGDPRNGILLTELRRKQGQVKVHIAYGGSCTGGKKADMDMYAEVVRRAVAKGRSLQAKTYIQFGSQRIRDYAEKMGYVQLFEGAGVELIDPSCGACIKAGPGVSFTADEVTVSAINRNFPGRSGPGQVYLASPLVVASSAFLGYVGGPDEL